MNQQNEGYTVVELEHLKTKTRLKDEKFVTRSLRVLRVSVRLRHDW
jgi:hypothetical protein